jgi:hypothetical protein
VTGSIPVTGWVLDDIQVSNVKIYRAPVAGEGTGMVYIGNAVLVDGARPDVEAAYPDYPLNYRAGWGYMLLTYGLPNQGSGTYTLYAEAVDAEGKTYALGSKTIISDNTDAVKPFGAIDTPAQGGIASGESYANFGWVLTPQPDTIPVDGSTITVWVDGVPLGNPVYNQYRSDIAGLFPGYNNSDGAGGQFYLDTTPYTNGVHTIAWTAADDAGNAEGIGSRYFTVQNWQGAGSRAQSAGRMAQSAERRAHSVVCLEPVDMIKGYARDEEPQTVYPDDNGVINIEINQLECLEIHLGHLNSSSFYSGYHLLGDQFRPLPIGSTLDTKTGIFYWHPGPAFKGRFPLVFVIESPDGQSYKKPVVVTIETK